jgi:hypothetical protein
MQVDAAEIEQQGREAAGAGVHLSTDVHMQVVEAAAAANAAAGAALLPAAAVYTASNVVQYEAHGKDSHLATHSIATDTGWFSRQRNKRGRDSV